MTMPTRTRGVQVSEAFWCVTRMGGEKIWALLTLLWVVPCGESWWSTAEAEHGQGDKSIGSAESERDAGDEPDLGVDRFDPPVGQAVFDGGQDRVLMSDDAFLQLDELGNPAAPRPADPPRQLYDRVAVRHLEDQPQRFLEQVGAVQGGVLEFDQPQRHRLLVGQILR